MPTCGYNALLFPGISTHKNDEDDDDESLQWLEALDSLEHWSSRNFRKSLSCSRLRTTKKTPSLSLFLQGSRDDHKTLVFRLKYAQCDCEVIKFCWDYEEKLERPPNDMVLSFNHPKQICQMSIILSET